MPLDLYDELARVVGIEHPGDRGGSDVSVPKEVHAEI
jgi:hypothetical protein